MARGSQIRAATLRGLAPDKFRNTLLKLYVLALGTLGLILVCALAYFEFRPGSLPSTVPFSWGGAIILLAVGIFAEKYTVKIGRGMDVSASFLAFFLSAALLGPLACALISAGSQACLIRRRELLRGICFVAAFAIIGGATALFYTGLISELGGSTQPSPIGVAAVGLAAGVLYQAVNFAVFFPVTRLRRGTSLGTVWREAFQPFLPFHFFFLAISLGLIHIYRLYVLRPAGASPVYSMLLIVLCLLPVLGLIYAFRAFAHERELAKHNAALAVRNERLFLQAVKSQVTALDVKDNYTARHSAAVARWATDIAQALALSKHEQNTVHLASLVHDVGKIGVPDEVLNYPGRVEGEAWRLLETHCQNGHKILRTIDQFGELAEVILYHHERYDGSGYPVGLIGDAIPLISRIICVADSYSAMVSDRPYRKALSTELAQTELRKHAGRQFDPMVVDCFLEVLAHHDDAYQRGELVDFDLEFSSDRFLKELPAEPVEEEEPGLARPPAKS
jgi:HD-GYP domain-containing protein (c-di-GMP phosphodiesterase class II)